MFIFMCSDPRGTLFPKQMAFGDRTIVLFHSGLYSFATGLPGFSFVFNNKTALGVSGPFINISRTFLWLTQEKWEIFIS